MADKSSILREAQKYLAKGQIDRAISEWEKLANLSPDAATLNFLGDLYLRKGDRKSAVASFHKTARLFRDEGFSLKALALYKKILNISPSDAESLYALGELNEEKEITTDAIKYYLAAADAFSKEGRKKELLGVYDRILGLAPTNIPLRIKVSELFSKEGFVREASREYLQIGRLFESQGETERASEYYARASEIQPGNFEAALCLAALHAESGDAARAATFARRAAQQAGMDTAARLHCARILDGVGLQDEAVEQAVQAVEGDAQNLEAVKFLAGLYMKRGELDSAWQHYSSALDRMIEAGQLDEALAILENFRDAEPIEAKTKLVALYRAGGDDDSAVAELASLSGLYEDMGMSKEAMEALAEALSIQPGNEALRERMSAYEESDAEAPAAVGAPAGPEAVLDDEITLDDEQKDALAEADMYTGHGLYDKAKGVLEGLKVRDPSNMEVHERLKALYLETGDTEQAVTECIILSELYGRAGDEGRKLALLREAQGINPGDPRVLERLGAAGEAAPAGNLEDELFEADFYIKQGFYREAADLLGRLVERCPENGELRERLEEAERLALESPKPGAAEAAPEPGEEISAPDELRLPIEEEISGEAGAPEEAPPEAVPPGTVEADEVREPELDSEVMEIFEEFKKGLEKEVEAEDSETHYNLGIAYKEMDLLDDAINSFQISKHDPDFFVRSASMLGVCYMQKGLYPLAINAFSSALMKTDPKDEAAWGLKYDLADAYEKNGSAREALHLFTEVYGWNSKFREISEKISRIKRALEADEAKKGRKNRVSYI